VVIRFFWPTQGCTGRTAVRSIERSIERTTGTTDRSDRPVRRAVVALGGVRRSGLQVKVGARKSTGFARK